jgi:hypothetical protein
MTDHRSDMQLPLDIKILAHHFIIKVSYRPKGDIFFNNIILLEISENTGELELKM